MDWREIGMGEKEIKDLARQSFDKGEERAYKNISKLILSCRKRDFNAYEILIMIEDYIINHAQ